MPSSDNAVAVPEPDDEGSTASDTTEDASETTAIRPPAAETAAGSAEDEVPDAETTSLRLAPVSDEDPADESPVEVTSLNLPRITAYGEGRPAEDAAADAPEPEPDEDPAEQTALRGERVVEEPEAAADTETGSTTDDDLDSTVERPAFAPPPGPPPATAPPGVTPRPAAPPAPTLPPPTTPPPSAPAADSEPDNEPDNEPDSEPDESAAAVEEPTSEPEEPTEAEAPAAPAYRWTPPPAAATYPPFVEPTGTLAAKQPEPTPGEGGYPPFVEPTGTLIGDEHAASVNGQATWSDHDTAYAPSSSYTYASESTAAYAEPTAYAGTSDTATGYAEEYESEQIPLYESAASYQSSPQDAYVASLMANERNDHPSTWVVSLWVGAIFMIALLVAGIWLMGL